MKGEGKKGRGGRGGKKKEKAKEKEKKIIISIRVFLRRSVPPTDKSSNLASRTEAYLQVEAPARQS